MNILKSIGKGITKMNYYVARFASFFIFAVMLLLVFEVVMRFALRYLPLEMHDPSRYVFDLSWMAYATFGFLGAGYVLSKDLHVKADVFYNMMNWRLKLIVNIICYPVLFFVTAGILVYSTFRMALNSFIIQESGMWTGWQVLVWPIRTVLFIGAVLLALQGIVKFVEIIRQLKGGEVS